jgi:hypothetical protein
MPVDALTLLLTGLLAAGVEPAASAPPDPELLEFLGSFETADGRWLDPLVLDERERAEAAPEPPREEKRHD